MGFLQNIALTPIPCIQDTWGKRKLLEMKNSGASERDIENPEGTISVMELARLLKDEIQLREKYFGGLIAAGHSWIILLELHTLKKHKHDSSVTKISTLGNMPATTGLRWIGVLKDEGLLTVANDMDDDRQKSVTLTDQGRKNMESYLEAVAEVRQLRLVS